MPNGELDEKDFIHEPENGSPFMGFSWAIVIALFFVTSWLTYSWLHDKLSEKYEESPFLQVTNRQLSLFLWQFPEYMRINAKNKSSYLPGFQYEEKVSMNLRSADKYAVAPPELLFMYHIWRRLLYDEFTPRKIDKQEFVEFLNYAEEWQPRYWPEAPKEYADYIENLDAVKDIDLKEIPKEVQMAFQGWKNYFKEGNDIENLNPAYGQMEEFIEEHPHYARNYWKNIVKPYAPDYLYTFSRGRYNKEDIVPKKEMTGFLQAGLYNYLKAKDER